MLVEVDKIVLLPRFTSLSGATDFYTVPINVRAYAAASICVYKGMGLGLTPAFSLQVEQSTDLLKWFANGTAYTPADGTEATQQHTLETEWLRLHVTLTGGGAPEPGYSCWVVGDFERRART